MTEETSIETSEETPVALVKNAAIALVLGKIEAKGVEMRGEAAANNTRWVFDVEAQKGQIEIRLLEFRSGRKLKPDLMSWSLVALNKNFYDARPVGRYEDGVFTLTADADFSCRVSIDVMHSATR